MQPAASRHRHLVPSLTGPLLPAVLSQDEEDSRHPLSAAVAEDSHLPLPLDLGRPSLPLPVRERLLALSEVGGEAEETSYLEVRGQWPTACRPPSQRRSVAVESSVTGPLLLAGWTRGMIEKVRVQEVLQGEASGGEGSCLGEEEEGEECSYLIHVLTLCILIFNAALSSERRKREDIGSAFRKGNYKYRSARRSRLAQLLSVGWMGTLCSSKRTC